MTSPAMHAFDMRLRLLRMLHDPNYSKFFSKRDPSGNFLNNPDQMEVGLRYGASYWVAPAICDLLSSAADQLRTPWVLHREWVPAPQGMFWFANSPSFTMTKDKLRLDTVGFSWTVFRLSGKGALMEQEVTLLPNGSPEFSDGIMLQYYSTYNGRVVPAGWATWRFGRTQLDLAEDERMRIHYENQIGFDEGIRDSSLVAATFQFIKQKLLSHRREPLGRTERKWIKEADNIELDPDVRIVTLRARKASGYVSPEDSTEVNWSCQWLVKGFWRDQWFPSLQTHQSMYIAPYVKGPEGKPLRVNKATLYAVTR